MEDGTPAERLAILETRVDNIVKDHAGILSKLDRLNESVEKMSKDSIKMQVYVKSLWPALSITFSIIGILIGRFVL